MQFEDKTGEISQKVGQRENACARDSEHESKTDTEIERVHQWMKKDQQKSMT